MLNLARPSAATKWKAKGKRGKMEGAQPRGTSGPSLVLLVLCSDSRPPPLSLLSGAMILHYSEKQTPFTLAPHRACSVEAVIQRGAPVPPSFALPSKLGRGEGVAAERVSAESSFHRDKLGGELRNAQNSDYPILRKKTRL